MCGVKLLLGEAGKEQETGITGAKARTDDEVMKIARLKRDCCKSNRLASLSAAGHFEDC